MRTGRERERDSKLRKSQVVGKSKIKVRMSNLFKKFIRVKWRGR